MEKCTIQTAAEREHDAPEIPAHAFRLVNTGVFSTSAFSMMLKKTHDFVNLGYDILSIFWWKMCLKHDKNSLEIQPEKRSKKEPKKVPKMTPK